ncbi:MAG: ATP-binding cassette domain-containing protein [Bdellovibrionales bacterium]|nr:ATP-binding cassette domain-containing protein [Bdellovibrionales bacterium]
MSGTGLEFKNFKVQRPSFTVEVQDFKSDLHEAIELQAPSGFGKTSVIRAILGLDPHSGEVKLQGVRLLLLPVHKRKIGMVFQDQVLFTHMNALENAMSGLLLQGRSEEESEKLALEGLEKFGIRDRAFARVGELSGGERQRVAILRATLWKPNLLILDEPFQGLDQLNRQLIKDYMAQFLAEHPIPMIWVDHQADFEGLHLVGEQRFDELRQNERRVFNLTKSKKD